MQFYPVNLNLSNRAVLLIADADSQLAEAKAAELELAGAVIQRISPQDYTPDSLTGIWLVLTLGDGDFNRQVFLDAEKVGVWVNAVDDPDNCSVILPARLRRGELLLTVSTAGLSPAFSSWVKNQLDSSVDSNLGELLEVVARVRCQIQEGGDSTESFNWQAALDLAASRGVLQLVQEGKTEDAENLIRECLSL